MGKFLTRRRAALSAKTSTRARSRSLSELRPSAATSAREPLACCCVPRSVDSCTVIRSGMQLEGLASPGLTRAIKGSFESPRKSPQPPRIGYAIGPPRLCDGRVRPILDSRSTRTWETERGRAPSYPRRSPTRLRALDGSRQMAEGRQAPRAPLLTSPAPAQSPATETAAGRRRVSGPWSV